MKEKKMESFEIAPCGSYRFVGKSVYLGNKKGSDALFGCIWEKCDWVFEELDKMTEYASDESYNAALFTWEKYDGKNELFGYYVGRFMKPDAPVPHGMDFFDVDEKYWGKAWTKGKLGDTFGNMLVYGERQTVEEIERAGYSDRRWVWMAEMYPSNEARVGIYIPCQKGE